MTEELQSKITDEHRAFLGRKSEPISVTVREEDVRRIRDLLGDTDPRWAEGTGMAPPYVIAMFQSGPRRGATPNVLPNGILTQQEWRFLRPFRIGEELQAVTQVIDIRDRLGGRYGYSVLVTMSTDFYGADGDHAGAVLITVTQFDPASARGSA
jgi:acyl dehydratase